MPFLPRRFSPIYEDSQISGHRWKGEGNIDFEVISSEINNSSIGKNPTESDSYYDFSGHTSGFRYEVISRRADMHTSGRRPETVEVLKQKYMNNEIHDLPRVNHGSMSRSSSILDSRKQLSKVKSSLNTGRRRYFQFKKTDNNPVFSGKSVEELLYGEFADEIDPELATLFEMYVNECDASSRRRARDLRGRLSDFVVCVPTADPGEDSSSTVSSLNSESGVEETNFCPENPSEILLKLKFDTGNSDPALSSVRQEAAVEGPRTTRRDVSAAAVMGAMNIRSLISRTQNVTHRHLTDWELQLSKEKDEDIDPCDIHNQDENDVYSLHVGKAHEPETLVGRMKEAEKTTNAEDSVLCTGIQDGQTEPFDKGDTAETDGNTLEAEVPFTRHRVANVRPKPKAEVRPRLRENNVIKDLNQLESRLSDEEEFNNFRLAKRKLKHKLMTTLVFEESILPQSTERQEEDEHHFTGRFWRECCRGATNKPRRHKQHRCTRVKSDAITQDDLDGWSTKNKHLEYPDFVSSSEVLHPVPNTSLEECYQMLWSPTASNHALWSPAVSKAENLRSTLDLQDETREDVSKHVNLRAGTMPPADLVKLRLTKSNASFRAKRAPKHDSLFDRPFSNNPLSHCASYNIEQTLRSNVMVTANINLSEKLSQQLKNLSQDTTPNRKQTARLPAGCPQQRQNPPQPNDDNNSESPLPGKFPDIDRSRDRVASVTSVKSKQGDTCLPSISSLSASKSAVRLVDQPSIDKDRTSLPPIRITTLTGKVENSQSPNVRQKETGYLEMGGNAVRSEVCTSPFMFDKGDPNKLKVLAKAIPAKHTVCTSCGCVSEAEPPKGRLRKSSKSMNVDKNTYNPINKKCCVASKQDQSQRIPFPTSNTSNRVKSPADRSSARLEAIAMPHERTKLECPIASETRIYKADFKRVKLQAVSSTQQTPAPVTPVSSPYLEYCKRKMLMDCSRKKLMTDVTLDAMSDTRLLPDHHRVYTQSKSFPVIPMKRSQTNVSCKWRRKGKKMDDKDGQEQRKPAVDGFRLPIITVKDVCEHRTSSCGPITSPTFYPDGRPNTRLDPDARTYTCDLSTHRMKNHNKRRSDKHRLLMTSEEDLDGLHGFTCPSVHGQC
ncbi:uncharacterized protein LOC127856042 isoform X2 [Dreissena polymorpha]|uniref:uncharacterized protein LOC127856042 isoform X2 n=1 Tax=Dreissena polymorpha TaxID=45954 RepID=UPI00226436FC|nr:uncharacterized protein LOC127856042 isoform X2 [Dreissena polymorpha]